MFSERPTLDEPRTFKPLILCGSVIPDMTNFRDISVATLDARRKALNAQLAASGKKVSFTHLIAYAIVQAVKQFPVMVHAFQDVDGKPHRVTPQGIGLGLAVDVRRVPSDVRGLGREGTHQQAAP